jgi:hypothetical protein
MNIGLFGIDRDARLIVVKDNARARISNAKRLSCAAKHMPDHEKG